VFASGNSHAEQGTTILAGLPPTMAAVTPRQDDILWVPSTSCAFTTAMKPCCCRSKWVVVLPVTASLW
jgi:hypothetical protein